MVINGVITHLEPDILECEVKWALGRITMNKASGGEGIPVELFQILKDAAVKLLHSTCQQIWNTQQWPQDWKRSVFIPVPAGSQHRRSHPWQSSWGRDLMGKGEIRPRGTPPEPSRASTPKPESVCFTLSCLSPTPLTLTRGYPRPTFSKEIQLRALLNKSPGHNRVFQSKPLRWLSSLPDRFVQAPAVTHVIVMASQPWEVREAYNILKI